MVKSFQRTQTGVRAVKHIKTLVGLSMKMSNKYLKLLLVSIIIFILGILTLKIVEPTDCLYIWKTQGEAAGEACFIEHPDDTEVTE